LLPAVAPLSALLLENSTKLTDNFLDKFYKDLGHVNDHDKDKELKLKDQF
jgi:hypothetical protein